LVLSHVVPTISSLLEVIGLFWKRALRKRPIFCKETYNFKEPANVATPYFFWWWVHKGVCVCGWVTVVHARLIKDVCMDESCDMTNPWLYVVTWHMQESCCIWMGHVAYGWVNFHLNRSCCTWRSPVAPVRVTLHVNESCDRRSEMTNNASMNASYHTRLSEPYIIALSDI